MREYWQLLNYQANKGEDNVHLNNLGVVRLAKYLKYFAHHRYNAHSST